jgi:hypothetical protein
MSSYYEGIRVFLIQTYSNPFPYQQPPYNKHDNILAEAAAVAEEGILLVVVDGAALVALEDVLPAVGADPRVGGHGGRAPRALQRLAHSLQKKNPPKIFFF